MKIERIKINGLKNPIGYDISAPIISFDILEARGTKLKEVSISIFTKGEKVYENTFFDTICTIDLNLFSRTRYNINILAISDLDEEAKGGAFFETGKIDENFEALWVGGKNYCRPIVLKEFLLCKKAKNARIYIAGIGAYEAKINGALVTNEFIAGLFSDFYKEVQYLTYDITDLLCENNKLEVELGHGMCGSRYGISGKDAPFTKQLATIFEIIVEYEDGTFEKFLSDLSCKYNQSNIVFDEYYDGETTDKTLANDEFFNVQKIDVNLNLITRTSMPLTTHEKINPIMINKIGGEEFLVDFGQNHTGLINLEVDEVFGKEVVIEFAEILQNGNFFRMNYGDAKTTIKYISGGFKDIIRPKFFYTGFRYAKISGVTNLKNSNIYSSALYSDIEITGNIETGNEKINRLFLNQMWSQKSNFLDIPLDCPQRDERLGWTGDAQVFARTSSYNSDTRWFLSKFLHELRLEQTRYLDGGVPNYIPSKGAKDVSSAWADCSAIISDVLDNFYGCLDKKDEVLSLIADWIAYIEKRNPNLLYENGFQFGDWLALDGISENSFKGSTDETYIASMYYYNSVKIYARLVEKYKDKIESRNYYEKAKAIKQRILDRYFTKDGRLSVDTQTAYILSLAFSVYVDENVIFLQYERRLMYDRYQMKTGFVGTSLLSKALKNNPKLLYLFLFNEKYPGWLNCVNLGATTIWERWNGLLEDGTFNDIRMNSFNHYSYGSIFEFLYSHTGGISPSESGFKKVIIAPKPDIRFGYMETTYNSIYGKYYIRWEILENSEIELEVSIPFNTTAEIQLPFSDEKPFTVCAGNYKYRYTPVTDISKLFDGSTKLFELSENERALNALKENLPQAYDIIQGENYEFLYKSIEDLKHLFFLGITEEQVTKTIEALKNI